MSLIKYKIGRFYGLDQSVEENFLKPGYTPYAYNMDTSDGNLRVAKGFEKLFNYAVPGTGQIHRMGVFRHSSGDIYMVFAGDALYVSNGGPWVSVYSVPTLTQFKFDMTEASISSTDYMLIGNGETNIEKFDGEEFSSFGSEADASNIAVRYLAMYSGRLFASGDSNHPNRLYWSQLPGDGRSIESWGANAATPNVEGGFVEVGCFDNDPITALCALSSQLLIFKRNSLYRLFGDKPSNYTLEEVDSNIPACAHTAILPFGDAAYFMTAEGMYAFDGVNVGLCKDAMKIKNILSSADVSECRACKTRYKMYFSLLYDDNSAIVEYDIRRGTYMLRNGFSVLDMVSRGNEVLFINGDRYVYRLDSGTTYDGEPIEACWKTPETDLDDMGTIKLLRDMRFHAQKNEKLTVSAAAGGIETEYTVGTPGGVTDEITELRLQNEGRRVRFSFKNVSGSAFVITGGVEVTMDVRGRCV